MVELENYYTAALEDAELDQQFGECQGDGRVEVERPAVKLRITLGGWVGGLEICGARR